jgi:hypothetical protein
MDRIGREQLKRELVDNDSSKATTASEMTLYSPSTMEHNSQSEDEFEKHKIYLEDIRQGEYPWKLIASITAFV